MRECRFLPLLHAQYARFSRIFALKKCRLRAFWAPILAFSCCFSAANGQVRDQIVAPIDTLRTQALTNHHPLWANPKNDAGAAPADLELNQLTLVLARSPEQEQAFEEFLAEQQNPASPEYHHWLTPEQVGERFGVSDHDLAAVRGWLESQGLHVNWIAPGRNFVGFGGDSAHVGRAFATELHYYNVNGAKRLSVASDPTIPAGLMPAIASVRGLYDIEDRPMGQVQAEGSAQPEFSNGGHHYIAPEDFATIYDLPANLSGAGVTIGIVGWSFVDFDDLTNFRERTGARFADPAEVVPTQFGGVNPGTAYTTAPTCSNCIGGQSEATLDVIRAGSVAQDANLLLVSSSSSGANNGIGAAAQYLIQTSPTPAQVIDISFGDCESDAGPSGVSYWNKLFQQAAAEGISVFVSSGDSGAAGCDVSFTAPPSSPRALSPNYICASSYATCVGGTEFNDSSNPQAYWTSGNGAGLASVLSYIPEGAWNEPLNTGSQLQVAASGGGVSSYVGTPSWQKGVSGVPAANSGRYTPDVAFAASCREAYFGCMAAAGGSCALDASGSYNFVTFCGTSSAAPGMAGIAALLNQQMGGQAQGNLNPLLYSMQAAPSVFHDVTVASSGVTNCTLNIPSLCNNSIAGAGGLSGGEAGYLVGTGFDEATGLGSLDVQAWINSMATPRSVSAGPQTPTFTLSGAPVTIAAGANAGNASAITVTPVAGFTGTVTLTAKVTSMPAGAQSLPALSFMPTNVVMISDANPGTATLTIATTRAQSTAAQATTETWRAAGGTTLACALLLWIPGLRRRRALLCAVAMLAALAGSAIGCGGKLNSADASVQSASGTTAGSYTITVTATSGSTTVTAPVVLIVQ